MIIGVLGGGQLGMMMAESAISLGHEIIALDDASHCPISKLAKKVEVDGLDSELGYEKLYQEADVLTYEFENVNFTWVEKYMDKIPQRVRALEISRERVLEKDFASFLGIPCPRYEKYNPLKEMNDFPFILKTTTLGYDGHGQYLIQSTEDIEKIKERYLQSFIKEELISFDYEISVILTRDSFGGIVSFPIPRNIHKNGILYVSILDDKIPHDIQEKAKTYASKIIEKLNYVGTLAVEFFVRGKDVLFNEFAPRPHNSGHFTIEGCNVSQYTNHILAITGGRVIEPHLLSQCAMLNILGQDMNQYKNEVSDKETHYHFYGKKEAKTNRKMGHVTFTGEHALEKLSSVTGEQF